MVEYPRSTENFDEQISNLLGERYDDSLKELFRASPEVEKKHLLSDLKRALEDTKNKSHRDEAIEKWITSVRKVLSIPLMDEKEVKRVVAEGMKKGNIEFINPKDLK